MGEVGFSSTGSFCEKYDLYGYMGLKITDTGSFLYFLYIFLIWT